MNQESNDPGVNHLIAGSLSGAVSTLLLHPLDLLKTRVQVGFLSKDCRHESLIQNIKYIYNSRGPLGFYQALTPNILGNLISWGINMHFFHTFGYYYQKNTQENKIPTHINFCLAFCSGFINLLITNPLWLIKVRMSMNLKYGPYYTAIGSLVHIHRTEGLKGFSKGIGFGVFSCIHGGVFLAIYEEIKYILKFVFKKENLSTTDFVIASSFSKCMANFTTYPVQVLRSRSQNFDAHIRYSSSIDIIKKTWKNERIFGFYKGLLPSTLRVLPSSCLNLLLYEIFINKIQKK